MRFIFFSFLWWWPTSVIRKHVKRFSLSFCQMNWNPSRNQCSIKDYIDNTIMFVYSNMKFPVVRISSVTQSHPNSRSEKEQMKLAHVLNMKNNIFDFEFTKAECLHFGFLCWWEPRADGCRCFGCQLNISYFFKRKTHIR